MPASLTPEQLILLYGINGQCQCGISSHYCTVQWLNDPRPCP